MTRVNALILAVTPLLALGCDKENDAGAGQAPASVEGSVAETAPAERNSDRKLFDRKLTRKACDILTPELVAKTFSVPSAELEQRKVMGCTYTWKKKDGDSETLLEARFTTITSHKTEEAARLWFANATRGMSQGEAKARMDDVTRQAKEREEIDTELKKKAADDLGGALSNAIGADGIQFESVEGIGDESRLNLSDGGVWVRTRNLTFVVSAYHGSAPPPPDIRGTDVKNMAKVALEANRNWLRTTLPQRKKDGTKLATAVLAALP